MWSNLIQGELVKRCKNLQNKIMYSGKDDIYQGPVKMSWLVITQRSGSWFKRKKNNLAPLIHHNKNKLQRDKKMNNKNEMIFLI